MSSRDRLGSVIVRCDRGELDDRHVDAVRQREPGRRRRPSNTSVTGPVRVRACRGRSWRRACRRAHPDGEPLGLPRAGSRSLRRCRDRTRRERPSSTLRAVDRAQLELRALGERECRRRRREQRHAERSREHPGHGPADSTPGPGGSAAPAHPAATRRASSRGCPDEAARSRRAPSRARDHERRLGHVGDLDPREDQHDAERDPEPALGHPDRQVRADQDARDRADEQPRHRVRVDVAVEQDARRRRPRAAPPRGTCRCRRSSARSAG